MVRPHPVVVISVVSLCAACAGEIEPPDSDAALPDTALPDTGGTPDKNSPTPDLLPAPATGTLSYGSKCKWTNKISRCSDGKSDCIPSFVSSTTAPEISPGCNRNASPVNTVRVPTMRT